MGPSPTTASETSLMTFVSTPRGRMCLSSRRMASASSRSRLRRLVLQVSGDQPQHGRA
jgi:hypothetical protein